MNKQDLINSANLAGKRFVFVLEHSVHQLGGLEIHMGTLANEVIKRGGKCMIISPKHLNGRKNGLDISEKIEIVNVNTISSNWASREFAFPSELLDPVTRLTEFAPDFIIVHQPNILIFQILDRIPKSNLQKVTMFWGNVPDDSNQYIEHDLDTFPINIKNILVLILNNLLNKKRSKKLKPIIHHMAVSKKVARSVHNIGISDFKNITVSNSPVIEKDFLSKKSKVAIPTNKLHILTVGRLSPEKGIYEILNVAKNLDPLLKDRNVIFEICGKGVKSHENKLRSNAGKINQQLTNCKIIFRGAKYEDDLLNMYRKSDFFMLLSPDEAYGRVYIEALLCGLPIIFTNNAGPKEIKQSSKFDIGYAAPIIPNTNRVDTNKIAEFIVKLFDTKFRQKYYDGAFQFGRSYSSKKILDEFFSRILMNL